MTIVAYASAAANPLQSRSDAVVELSQNALPVAETVFYGAAEDSGDNNAQWSWAWTIASKPPTSSVAFKDGISNTQNISLVGHNVWGNVVLLLVATNLNTNQSSQTSFLLAPDSARVTLRVKSPNKGLQKIAAGERNHADESWALVQAVEDQTSGGSNHNILDHADVSFATGSDLDILVGAGIASRNLQDPNSPALHRHRGADVEPPSTSLPGTVIVETAAAAGSYPKVPVNDHVPLVASVQGSRTKDGYLPGQVVPADYGHAGFVPSFGKGLAYWRATKELKIDHWAIVLGYAGSANAAAVYKFHLYHATAAGVLNNTLNGFSVGGAGVETTLTLNPANDNDVAVGERAFATPLTVAAGDYLVVCCTQAPAPPDEPGGNLTVTVFTRRSI